jgi:hypothetical protein
MARITSPMLGKDRGGGMKRFLFCATLADVSFRRRECGSIGLSVGRTPRARGDSSPGGDFFGLGGPDDNARVNVLIIELFFLAGDDAADEAAEETVAAPLAFRGGLEAESDLGDRRRRDGLVAFVRVLPLSSGSGISTVRDGLLVFAFDDGAT